MRGKFEATLKLKAKITMSTIHIVKGSSGCLLSYKTASASGLVIFNVQAHPSCLVIVIAPRPSKHEAQLEEYDSIFDGISQLKDFKVKLHIDNLVITVA